MKIKFYKYFIITKLKADNSFGDLKEFQKIFTIKFRCDFYKIFAIKFRYDFAISVMSIFKKKQSLK